jgi:hypothetical protein
MMVDVEATILSRDTRWHQNVGFRIIENLLLFVKLNFQQVAMAKLVGLLSISWLS